MRTIQTVIIGILIGVTLIGGYIYYENLETQKTQDHIKYCNNWYNSIDQDKKALINSGSDDPSLFNRLNSEVSNYNKECSF